MSVTSKYDSTVGTLREDFSVTGDFTMTNGTCELNNEFIKEGTSSLKITATAGTTCSAVKTVNWSADTFGRIYFWLYVPDISNISSVQIALSNDSGFSNYFTLNVSLHEGWNKVLIGRTTWGSVGTPSWSSTIVRLRIRINATAGGDVVLYANSMYSNYDTRPKCIISFDDNYDDVYDYAYPIMRRFGFPGALYIITNYLDSVGRLSIDEINELHEAGWDAMNHTNTHINLESVAVDQAQVESELSTCRDILSSNGWTRRNENLHVAYPQGGYDTKTLAAMESLGMITGRTTRNRTQANYIDNLYLLTRQSHDYTASQSTYRGWIDRTIADGGCIQLNYHQIVTDGTASAGTQVEESQFTDMMNYIASKKSSIDVISWTEWYRGLTNARKIV